LLLRMLRGSERRECMQIRTIRLKVLTDFCPSKRNLNNVIIGHHIYKWVNLRCENSMHLNLFEKSRNRS
jgi:hypothetical protein